MKLKRHSSTKKKVVIRVPVSKETVAGKKIKKKIKKHLPLKSGEYTRLTEMKQ